MQDDVGRIKDRINIEDVVADYVKLIPAGSRLKGLSPFTKEKTPSFFVSPDRGLWHCFSTNKGGDVFTFVQELEGVDFSGALKILADRAGIELTGVQKKKEPTDDLFAVLEAATAHFESNFNNSNEAKKYAKDRGLNEDSLKRFRIGYAPDEWRDLHSKLSLNFSDEVLIKAGLIKKKDGKSEPYDAFRSRLMFPIRDAAGRVCAFSGRLMGEDDKSAKYINSPETPVFNKSKVLYGFFEAKRYLRQFDYSLLVEGQFDIVLAHQVGNYNTVASSGTAFTPDHLKLLKRHSENLLLAFDFDKAGIAAALKVTRLAFVNSMTVKMLSLPEGTDPADMASSNIDEWKRLLREATSVPVTVARRIKESGVNDTKLRKFVRKEIIPIIALLKSPLERDREIKELSNELDIGADILKEEVDLASSAQLPKRSFVPKILTKSVQSIKAPSINRADSRESLEVSINVLRAWIGEKYPDNVVPELPENFPENKNVTDRGLIARDWGTAEQSIKTLKEFMDDWVKMVETEKIENQIKELDQKGTNDPEVINRIFDLYRQLDKLRS